MAPLSERSDHKSLAIAQILESVVTALSKGLELKGEFVSLQESVNSHITVVFGREVDVVGLLRDDLYQVFMGKLELELHLPQEIVFSVDLFPDQHICHVAEVHMAGQQRHDRGAQMFLVGRLPLLHGRGKLRDGLLNAGLKLFELLAWSLLLVDAEPPPHAKDLFEASNLWSRLLL